MNGPSLPPGTLAGNWGSVWLKSSQQPKYCTPLRAGVRERRRVVPSGLRGHALRAVLIAALREVGDRHDLISRAAEELLVPSSGIVPSGVRR